MSAYHILEPLARGTYKRLRFKLSADGSPLSFAGKSVRFRMFEANSPDAVLTVNVSEYSDEYEAVVELQPELTEVLPTGDYDYRAELIDSSKPIRIIEGKIKVKL